MNYKQIRIPSFRPAWIALSISRHHSAVGLQVTGATAESAGVTTLNRGPLYTFIFLQGLIRERGNLFYTGIIFPCSLQRTRKITQRQPE